jgi:ubiquinone/menaquinone biosynthesis C-methylase UbiE
MRTYKEADKEAYAKMTPQQQFYEENKPISPIEYIIRRRKFDALLSITGSIKDKFVLSVGCAGGMDCEWISLEGANTFGVDVSKELIKIAKKRLKKKKLNFKLVIGDMENLPFNFESFDTVITYDSLHHADDIHKTLLEINRITKNFIGIVEPNKYCLTRKLANIFFKKLLIEHCGLPTKAYDLIFYLREFVRSGFVIKNYIFCNIMPPELCTSEFKISYNFFGSFILRLTPMIDKLFEMIFPYSCSACILVGKKIT